MEVEDEIYAVLDKCNNDADKFLSQVANALKKKTNFFDDVENKLILNKYFDCFKTVSVPNVNEDQPADNQSNTVNEESTNDSVGKILVPATQYNPPELSDDENTRDDLIIDETAESGLLNGDSMRERAAEDMEGDDDENLIIPETQYAPNHDSDDESRASSSFSLDNGAKQKRVSFLMDFGKSDTAEVEKPSMDTSGGDEGDEPIYMDQETNSSWVAAGDRIDASQAVIGNLDSEFFGANESTSHRNDKLTDSISLSTTCAGNASKVDAEAPNEPAPNATATSQPNANTIAISFLTSHDVERSTSTTPDIEFEAIEGISRSSFDTRSSTPKLIAGNGGSSNMVHERTSTSDSSVANKHLAVPSIFDEEISPPKAAPASRIQANRVPVASSVLDDRSTTPELFTVNSSQTQMTTTGSSNDERSSSPGFLAIGTSQANKGPTAPSDGEMMTADMNDDSYSNDNELYGAITQVFPTPVRQPLRVSNQALNNSMNDSNTNRSGTIGDVAATADGTSIENVPRPNGNVVSEDENSNDMFAAATQMNPFIPAAQQNPVDDDEDSNDMFAAATQMNPSLPVAAPNHVSDRIVPPPSSSKSSKENQPNQSTTSEMGAPAIPTKPRKSNSIGKRTSLVNTTGEDDMFAAQTQEFVPAAQPSAGPSDSIYDQETQKLVLPERGANGGSNQKRSSNPDSEEPWPPNTPTMSIAARVSERDLERNHESSSRKPKKLLSKKWLFESEQNDDEDIDAKSKSPPKKKTKNSTEKRKSENIERVSQEPAKKTRQSVNSLSVGSDEVNQICTRRVSVSLQRLKIDVNSNVAANDERSPRTPKQSSARQLKSSKNNVKGEEPEPRSATRKNRETETKSKLNKRMVSDITPNRTTRATTRSKVVSFDSPKLRNAPQSESRDITRSSRSRNAGALVATSSSDVPLSHLATRSESRENAQSVSSVGSRSKSARRPSSSSVSPAHRIMFTKVNLDRKGIQRAVAKIPAMGGETVDCPSQCTVLVCEKLFRTNKLMSAVNRGIPIVTPAWLIASHKQNRFVDTEPYCLQDGENERRFDFNLKSSLERAKESPLFKDYMVFVTPNIIPPPNEIISIVECGGGICTSDYRAVVPSHLSKFTVSSTTDALLWKKIRGHHPGILIVNTEGLMRSVLRQTIDFSGYKLAK